MALSEQVLKTFKDGDVNTCLRNLFLSYSIFWGKVFFPNGQFEHLKPLTVTSMSCENICLSQEKIDGYPSKEEEFSFIILLDDIQLVVDCY